MPIYLTEVKTPKGRRVARSEFVSEVTLEDARRFLAASGEGTPFANLAFLVVGNVSGVSGEVKKLLSTPRQIETPMPVAVVLNSAIARMLAGLVLRTNNNKKSDYFKTEAEALAWLDEV